MRDYQKRNREKINAWRQLYNAKNMDRVRQWRANMDPAKSSARQKRWRDKNKEYQYALTRAWMQANKPRVNQYAADRRARLLNATPQWLSAEDHESIAEWYRLATHFGETVDHIVPLQGKNVCGLHVPWNLQLLPGKENSGKGHHLIYDALDKAS